MTASWLPDDGVPRPSQSQRVMAVLADGRPHDIQEIHARAGTMRLNSRVAELRKRGADIVCWRADGTYVYQLIPAALDSGVAAGAASPESSAAPEPPSDEAASTYQQLALA